MKLRDYLTRAEREYWLKMLDHYPTRTAAAKAAGLSRQHMYARFAVLDIPRRQPVHCAGNAAFRALSDATIRIGTDVLTYVLSPRA